MRRWFGRRFGGPSQARPADSLSVRPSIWERHFVLFAALVLVLAALNVAFRLNRETITEWDESLYGTSAWEMLQSGDWISTTFLGSIDYYNAKPPLNIWLIALSFKAFGVSAYALRFVSIVSAWLTVLLLMLWARRAFDSRVAVFAGLVLTTSFGFIYVHSARTANTDALFTLLVLMCVIAVHAARLRPWHRLWLGPILAAGFLLRGTAILLPLAIVWATAAIRPKRPHRWLPTLVALLLFIVPVLSWGIARWRIDQWQFFDKLWGYDLVARVAMPLEGHAGSPFYYLDVLQKYQYDWLIAGAVAVLLFTPAFGQWRRWLLFWRSEDDLTVLIGCWAAATFLVPTVMQTKAAWYLDSFYPVFALGIALCLRHGSVMASLSRRRLRSRALAVTIVLAFGVAQGKLIWNSFQRRDVARSVQGLLQMEKAQLAGHQVFRDHWNKADRFVLIAMVGGEPRLARTARRFIRQSQDGDYLMTSETIFDRRLVPVRTVGSHTLYRRRGGSRHGARLLTLVGPLGFACPSRRPFDRLRVVPSSVQGRASRAGLPVS